MSSGSGLRDVASAVAIETRTRFVACMAAAAATRATASLALARPVHAETPAAARTAPPASAERYACAPLKSRLIATARSGGRSPVARTRRTAATRMSSACKAPTSAAACHSGRIRTAAKNTADATLTLMSRLMWSGNSSASRPPAASDAITHQSGDWTRRSPVCAAMRTSTTAPAPRRYSSERWRGVKRRTSGFGQRELQVERLPAPAVSRRQHRARTQEAGRDLILGLELEQQPGRDADRHVDGGLGPAADVHARGAVALERQAQVERR